MINQRNGSMKTSIVYLLVLAESLVTLRSCWEFNFTCSTLVNPIENAIIKYSKNMNKFLS